MSKLSRFLIGVIIAGLAFITGLHLYRAYERYAQAQQESQPFATQTFNQVPVSFQPMEPEVPVYKRYPEDEQPQEIYLEDAPLTPEAAKEQARQTVKSILADYQKDEKVQAFYAELQKSTGQDIKLEDLSGENLGALLQQHPQLQEVISKYTKDPEFAKTLQEIFANPQFVQSVMILQQQGNQPRK